MQSLRDHWIDTYRVICCDRLSDLRIIGMGDSGLLSAAVAVGLEKRLAHSHVTKYLWNLKFRLQRPAVGLYRRNARGRYFAAPSGKPNDWG